ncbi:MAG: peptidase dimerization domain-containing protein, partial [Nocardioides sp.]|uniref:M20 metallopeptidase family protein n=1 Tax=Nocardioides sp. TaxID=35761 RepID=UPI0039E66FB9
SRAPDGGRDLLAAGALERHGVGAVVGAHVQPILTGGTVAATTGAVNAASDQFEIVVRGRGGHGGYPHLAHDPVVAMAQVIVMLQQVVSRRINPLHSAVLTIGSVHAGSAANVIPDEARAQGTLRVLDESGRTFIREELTAVVSQVASALGCQGEVIVHEGEPALVNDPALTERTHPWLTGLGFEISAPLRSCGADDFSYYGGAAPSLMMFVGVDQTDLPDRAEPAMLHSPRFRPPDASVGEVARALLAGYLGAVDLLAGVDGAAGAAGAAGVAAVDAAGRG